LLGGWDVNLLRSRHGTRWRLWDILIGIVAFALGFALSPWHQDRLPAWYYLLLVGGLYGVYLAACSRLCGVPDPEDRATTYELVSACLLAVLLAYVLLSLTAALVLVRAYGRYITLTILTYSFCGVLLPRYWFMHLFARRPLNVVLYGAGAAGKACLDRIAPCRRLRAQGFLDANPELHGKAQFGLPVLGSVQDLERNGLGDVPVDVVVICVGSSLLERNAAALLRLPLHGIEVLTMGAFVEQYFRLVPLDYDSPHWFASARSVPGNAPIFAAKRILDLAVAVPGLILTLPLWALIAAAIKLDSRGPALFRQARVGRFGRTFSIIKFRSMRVDAEKDGPQWAKRNDPRVTRLGHLLRLTRLDELPQLWNVLKGEMSLVGPRPERPEFVQELAAEIPLYAQRHLVPPGLTGYAQISYRYGASKEDAVRKLEYDLFYSRHLSFMFDCEILVKTIPLLMKGSR
jgi:exopolysaccharide biosynthesis polyprenyl glycosylphosphotransferase